MGWVFCNQSSQILRSWHTPYMYMGFILETAWSAFNYIGQTSYLELLPQTVYQIGTLHRVGNLTCPHFCQETSTPDNSETQQEINKCKMLNLHKMKKRCPCRGNTITGNPAVYVVNCGPQNTEGQKQITEINKTVMVKNPHWPEQTSWLFTGMTKELNLGLPRKNLASS